MIRVYVFNEEEGCYKNFKSYDSMKNWLKNNPEFQYDHLTTILV